MQLKSIKLAGFKSFVDPTIVPIKSHMNAVVGPNGCGKSNIVDAIRWVIGEGSAKKLRGESSTDVIFNGTTARKPVGKAAIELNFDNSDARIGGEYAKFTDVSVRREVERDGQSSYFINGVGCRRRDVIDIFLGTGMGPRSYSIIEQGMISQLIEAKPEDLRVYLEEAAGISKYKERRRDTENRIRRTRENLDRLNDIREELDKQLRHLKRQANAAERYKVLKEEERQVHAETKALQWQGFDQQMAGHEARIQELMTQQEEALANQRHAEAEIEKERVTQESSTETQNEVQKRFYGLGAEIARVEQRIKHTQDQTERWQRELEETQTLWQELTDSTEEHRSQMAGLNEELETLNPQSSDINTKADASRQALEQAQAQMDEWRSGWEDFQQKMSQSAQQAEVARTKIAHHERQQEQLQHRATRLREGQQQQQLDLLQEEVAPLREQAQQLAGQLDIAKTQMQAQSDRITDQRQANRATMEQLEQVRQEYQGLQSRYASLDALQQSLLGYDDEAMQAWLQQHQLQERPRLGKELQVEKGWEFALETVLSGYFDAICVEDLDHFSGQMSDLSQGRVTLIDRQGHRDHSNQFNKAVTLSSKVQCDWPIDEWLSGVYIAEDLTAAKALRSQLSGKESIITRDGIWLGVNWLHVSKPVDNESGILQREQTMQQLQQQMTQVQSRLNEQEAILQQGRADLVTLESERDQQQHAYQELSAQMTKAQAKLSAEQSRLQEIQQQQQRLQEELNMCLQQQENLQLEKTQAQEQLEAALSEVELQQEQKQTLLANRDRFNTVLEEARVNAQREQQKIDELSIRIAANESQLALLTQTVTRDERQLEQLTSRRETLSANLADSDGPLESLNQELQEQLNQRVVIEQELREAEAALAACNQNLKNLEALRQRSQQEHTEAKDRMQALQMEHQEVEVRKTTLCEQLQELDLQLEAVIEAMPEEANIAEWEQRAQQLAMRIHRLGAINLAAIEEYDTTFERKEYLDKQDADLQEALNVLENAIRKIDRETKSRFRETYDTVNKGFQETFPRIFGGGRATLEMSDDDLLTTGIIVKAQPPGKRNTTIHLLSGGEKALTAISLVFALFQLNPAPFCVLDEVDAPLDDLNVGRFCQMVKEMSKNTQFIVISHNKVTISMADHLMGITMQEAGVSRLVSVDMEEALEMVEA